MTKPPETSETSDDAPPYASFFGAMGSAAAIIFTGRSICDGSVYTSGTGHIISVTARREPVWRRREGFVDLFVEKSFVD